MCVSSLQDDPLQETLEAMLPRADGVQADVGAEGLGRLPEGVAQVCRDLQSEEGISAIRLGRQVEERRTVSQVRTAHIDSVNSALSWTKH